MAPVPRARLDGQTGTRRDLYALIADAAELTPEAHSECQFRWEVMMRRYRG